MKAILAAAALIAALPTVAAAQPLLTNPADANRDGTVTDEEKADYLARKAGDPRNTAALPVSAPKPGGGGAVFKPGGELQDPDRNTTAAGEPPAAASDFEKQLETRIRKDAEDDR